MPNLLFVYNANSNLKSKVFDYTHKLFSPSTYQCHLCSITHNNVGKRTQWEAFLENTSLKIDVSYKDQFIKDHPNYSELRMPLIFSVENEVYKLIIDSAELESLSLSNLIDKLSNLD
jgi:hypothetical protein